MLRGKRLAGLIESIEAKFDRILDEQTADQDRKTRRKRAAVPDYDLAPKWGIQNGLTVVMDTLSDWNPASVRQDFLGIQVARLNIIIWLKNYATTCYTTSTIPLDQHQ